MTKVNEVLKNNIQTYIQENDRVEVGDISKALNMDNSDDFKVLVKAIAELEREQKIQLTNKGKFKIKDKNQDNIQGKFSATDRGFGFVIVEDSDDDDIFIPASETQSAFDGDIVAVEITEEADKRNDRSAEGKITEIIERKTTSVVGEFYPYEDDEVKDMDLYGYVKPNVKGYPDLTIQIETNGLRPVQGEIVKVDITRYPKYKNEDTMGIVTETIGHKDEPGIDILSIVHKHGIPSEFPEEVIEEAKQVPDEISDEDLKGRKDLRGEEIITIDGADAKDLDDAVQVKKLDNGNYYLGVHIADVAHYVKEGSAMDREALNRGTSSYLTDRVIPMLPQRLSNGICSLHPNVDRLTLSCEMEINNQGDVVKHEIFPSVIRSIQRMTYSAVNAILDDNDEETRKEYEALAPSFELMAELHHILEAKRERRGAIDFESTEAKIEVDDEGHPTEIKLLERGTGERLIESFMLLANETVSEHFAKRQLPILYRVHEQPDESKIQRFLEFITTFGITVQASKNSISPKDLQEVLDKVKGEPAEVVLNMLLLRSMQQARYDVDPIGHYGIGAEYYSHFTSPIRRYPDLILHRLIHYYNEVGTSAKDKKRWEEKLPEIGQLTSAAERRAIDAERETDELKKAEYMADKVGEEFKGTIVSITGFGMFVQLPNTIEGLIHISLIDDDYYEFNEQHLVLVGQRTGKVFKIGQEIDVRVKSVNTDEIQIDFEIVKDYAEVDENKKSKRQNKKNKKGRRDNNSNHSDSRNRRQNNGNQRSNKKNKKKNKKNKRKFKIRKKN